MCHCFIGRTPLLSRGWQCLLTLQSSGTAQSCALGSLRFAPAAPHFHVSAIHYSVMRSFLPTPPPFLSVTVCGLGGATVAQRLVASRSSAVQARGGSRQPQASAPFAVCAPWFALVRACGSRCLFLVRLDSWLLDAPCFVGRQQSRYVGRSINRSSHGCANPALNLAPFSRWTLRDKPAQRRLALR